MAEGGQQVHDMDQDVQGAGFPETVRTEGAPASKQDLLEIQKKFDDLSMQVLSALKEMRSTPSTDPSTRPSAQYTERMQEVLNRGVPRNTGAIPKTNNIPPPTRGSDPPNLETPQAMNDTPLLNAMRDNSDRDNRANVDIIKIAMDYFTNYKFNPETMLWQQWFTNFMIRMKAGKVDMTYPGNDQELKYALFLSLSPAGQQQAALYSPLTGQLSNLPWNDYQLAITKLFTPPELRFQSICRYRERNQGGREPILSYVNDKWALYKQGPGRDHEDWEVVKHDIIMGLNNAALRKSILYFQSHNIEELKNVITHLANLEDMDRAGKKTDNAISGSSLYRKTADRQNQVSAVTDDDVNAIATPPRSRRCWDCGSFQHFANSPKCPTPGAGKFRPKEYPARNNESGQRGRGRAMRRGNSGRRGGTPRRTYRNTVNHLEYDYEDEQEYEEEEEDQYDDYEEEVEEEQEDPFLEYTLPPQNPI